jgi:hypothetical protein
MYDLIDYKDTISLKAKADVVSAFRKKESGAFANAVNWASMVADMEVSGQMTVVRQFDDATGKPSLWATHDEVRPYSDIESKTLVRITNGDIKDAYAYHHKVQKGASASAIQQTAANKVAKLVREAVTANRESTEPSPSAFATVASALPVEAKMVDIRSNVQPALSTIYNMLKDGTAATTWDTQNCDTLDAICNLWLDTVKEEIADKGLASMKKVAKQRAEAIANIPGIARKYA